MFERQKERWRVKREENPLGRLPVDVRRTIIYGDSDQCDWAYGELFAWSRATKTEISDFELEFLADARAQLGPKSKRNETSRGNGLRRILR